MVITPEQFSALVLKKQSNIRWFQDLLTVLLFCEARQILLFRVALGLPGDYTLLVST